MRRVTEQLNVRVEPELRAALETAAERDRRPMASLVRNVLADWVEQRTAPAQERASPVWART
jgi:predicted HicB family RNase H-like nuclease